MSGRVLCYGDCISLSAGTSPGGFLYTDQACNPRVFVRGSTDTTMLADFKSCEQMCLV